MNPLALLRVVPLRFYLYAGIAAFIGYLLWREHSLARKVTTLRAEVSQTAAELDAKETELEQERANAARARKSSDDYQQQLEDLRKARAATPTRTVRLCLNDDVPATAGGHHEAGDEGFPEAPRPDPRISRDIGPEVYALADEADQCAAQRDALIDWIRSTTP